MKADKENKNFLDIIKDISLKNPELEISIQDGIFKLHYKTLMLDLPHSKDAIDAINAFQVLENLGAQDF